MATGRPDKQLLQCARLVCEEYKAKVVPKLNEDDRYYTVRIGDRSCVMVIGTYREQEMLRWMNAEERENWLHWNSNTWHVNTEEEVRMCLNSLNC